MIFLVLSRLEQASTKAPTWGWGTASSAVFSIPSTGTVMRGAHFAACSRGDRSTVAAILTQQPDVRNEIGPEHYAAFYGAAARNDLGALESMLACGFDPNRGDESIGKTALHVAAME